MDWIGANSLIGFFLDKSRSFGSKTALFFVIIGMFFIVDYVFDFTYYWSNNQRITQLERIQSLKRNYSQDSLKMMDLTNLEVEIFNKKHYTQQIKKKLIISDNKFIEPSKIEKLTENKAQTPSKKNVSTTWMVISSNYFLLLVFPILIFLPLFPGQKFDKNTAFGWLALNVVWVGIISFITYIAFLIPIINGNPTNNYWLNAGIHLIFMILIGFVSKKKK
ncbi:hypothetical protein [Mongoliitalea lutea]|uniref:Uncharacterized protein n=1 Tax=Mongoliitalea lutea TaxID=849756 RepID=A0A8J3CY84_9BACT|nr:hypothetical protein [Mongoliitalea lutea]GHB47347.1 hypothetical protein GCM10008106_30380 [Mongoliitalea lutea]